MNAASLPRLQVIILAAGLSSRLGEPKALAQIRGTSLLRRTLHIAAALKPARIIAVVPCHAARYRMQAQGMQVVFSVNPHPASGLSSSVRCGIAKARYAAAILLLPVDLVNLRQRDIGKLISHWRAVPRCMIARRIGRRGGTPVILPRWLFARARELKGDVGFRELADRLPRHAVRLIDLPAAELDVDTQQDLRNARRRLRPR
jgi:molybdenum cofactor cytidylyltransferase